MSPIPSPNATPATPTDDDEALLAAAQAQLVAAQARIMARKEREAEEARLQQIWVHEEWERLEKDVKEFLAGNRDRAAAEHVRWVEEVQEAHQVSKRTIRAEAERA